MATEHTDLIAPDETAFRLELTPAQLKVTHTALRALLSDFGHDDYDPRFEGPEHRACNRAAANQPKTSGI